VAHYYIPSVAIKTTTRSRCDSDRIWYAPTIRVFDWFVFGLDVVLWFVLVNGGYPIAWIGRMQPEALDIMMTRLLERDSHQR